MTIDTSVLDTSKAVAPDLAWSLADGDDEVVDFPVAEPEPAVVERAEGARYSWGAVWRRAVLLVVTGAAAAAVITSAMPAPTATVAMAPQSPTPDSDIFIREEAADGGPDTGVCTYIRAGHTPQQAAEAELPNNGALTPKTARDYVDAALRAYCPELSVSAARH